MVNEIRALGSSQEAVLLACLVDARPMAGVAFNSLRIESFVIFRNGSIIFMD